MPTINGHPYHLTTTTTQPFFNEPTNFQAITTPPTPPLSSLPPPTEERWTLSGLGEWTPSSSTRRTRSNIRHVPRIPRLRRPVSLEQARDSIDPISHSTQHMSISSAISSTASAHLISSPNVFQQDQCLDPVDITTLFTAIQEDSFSTRQKTDNYDYLDFQLVPQKTSSGRSLFDIENYISYQNGGIYRVFDSQNTIDLGLEYAGRGKSCVVSQIIIMSPKTGYSPPCRDGMVLISHQPFDKEETRYFDNFTKTDYEQYQESKTNGDDRVAAWFQVTDDQPLILDLGERSGQYILIKLFPSDYEGVSLELYYVGLLGYIGARSFAKAQLL